MYVAIEGVIGVGKTTLARLLQSVFQSVVLEVFEENPFLSDFYSDRQRYAFQTQIFFLLSRYYQQRRSVPEILLRGEPLISDYTFSKDALFARINLVGDELDMYYRVHDALAEKIPLPDLIVYLPPETPVLEEINLDIPAHQVVALVGPTGVGKSTLVSLISRFSDVTSGCITLDGEDIRQFTLESLRKQISIVLQDVFLFHGSVRENILFGRLNATAEEIIAASRAANCHEFIERPRHGYDSRVGERGVKLSVGEKQRVSIARALLRTRRF